MKKENASKENASKEKQETEPGGEIVDFRPSFPAAVFIILYLIVSMSAAIFYLNEKLHIAMLSALGVTILILTIEHCPWKKIEDAMVHGGKLMITTALILYSIGALMGAWIASGTVPMIIYWGLKLISPSVFLFTACLACLVTSMATGSSWSAIGTAGVALIGVGMGLGINPAMTAGAIVSGAAFGDKMSPLSDTTNMAPAVAEGDLFDHIKAMVYTTGPGIAIALIAFLFLGMNYSGSGTGDGTVELIMTSLNNTFNLNLVTLIPPVLVLSLAVMKKPAFPILLISALTAGLIAIFVQGYSLPELAAVMQSGFVSDTGMAQMDSLLSRGGLLSMNGTCSLGIIAMVYGGILERLGVLEVLLSRMKFVSRSVGTLVCSTVIGCILVNMITASQYMSIILTGRLFIGEYKKKDMLPQTLSRTLEDGGTVTSLIVPWNVDAAFAAASLGVPVMSFLPFAVFNWVVPVIAITYGFLGKFQWKTGEIKSVKTYRQEAE